LSPSRINFEIATLQRGSTTSLSTIKSIIRKRCLFSLLHFSRTGRMNTWM
jgi:hypothetical protein